MERTFDRASRATMGELAELAGYTSPHGSAAMLRTHDQRIRHARGRARRRRVRIVCRVCRRLLDRFDEVPVDERSQAGTPLIWWCDRCDKWRWVQVPRLLVELPAARARGDNVVELPLR